VQAIENIAPYPSIAEALAFENAAALDRVHFGQFDGDGLLCLSKVRLYLFISKPL